LILYVIIVTAFYLGRLFYPLKDELFYHMCEYNALK
jgi:hypothetical protein